MMRNGKPNNGSGKTFFNRIKKSGQSWTKLRDEAVKAGTFRRNERQDSKEESK